ncbi:thiopeptide maturation pyridine synthase [Salinispora pacifica]|uniref:thiopeptide maturation pyridine synthase n=1 Tax=Salinispora pacifica TaxID=351187 RepID=UPI0004AF78B7|nr:thiopeptide maturation pyridine synthase [Salinispora pacifica]
MSRWRCVAVHYHDESRDRLVVEAVEPLFARLGTAVPRAYHLRHWLRGPHLRLMFDVDDAAFDTTVLPLVEEVVGGFLVRHPSTTVLDPDRTLAQHRRLAELEQIRDSLTPFRPDNSIREIPVDERIEVLGSATAAELLAEFHVATTPLAFAAARQTLAGSSLPTMAYDLMIASAHLLSSVGFARGFVSFRSHADAFLSWWPEAHGLRERWQDRYAAYRPELLQRTKRLLSCLDTGSANGITTWARTVEPVRRRGEALIRSGALSMDPPWAEVDLADPRNADVVEMLRRSPFHRHALGERRPVHRTWFATYRLVLNYTYLYLTRLGLTPLHRFMLCHFAANVAEELYGVAAADVVLPAPTEVAG